jgi:hypothetical protein
MRRQSDSAATPYAPRGSRSRALAIVARASMSLINQERLEPTAGRFKEHFDLQSL